MQLCGILKDTKEKRIHHLILEDVFQNGAPTKESIQVVANE
jgi:hypothetical protein